MNGLSAFMCHAQTQAVKRAAKGEEKQFFFDKVAELHRTIQAMPQIHELSLNQALVFCQPPMDSLSFPRRRELRWNDASEVCR